MKKVKHIIKSISATQAVLTLAVVLSVIAAAMLISGRTPRASFAVPDVPDFSTVVDVASGDTLSTLFAAQGIKYADVLAVDKILRSDAKILSLRAESDKIVFVRDAADAPISKIIVIPSPWRQVELTQNADGAWVCTDVNIERDTRVVYRSGKILDGDSFFLAGQRADIPANVLANVYDLLAFEMDFERDIRAGQQFFVLYEENYSDGKKIDNGNILAVQFQALRGNVNMYRFKKSDDKVGYYDEKGNGAIKSLKRTPINNAKITSSFSTSRKHPVLGFTRAHKGVDFRAPTGTPIPSAGAGRVIKRGYNSGHGNYVKIRHNASYETLYAHLSKFQKGVVEGSTVTQGQIIGYAGATGTATGPHLHYEIIKDGVHVNPMTVKLPAIDDLGAKDKEKFLQYRQVLSEVIEQLSKNPDLFIQL